MRQPNVVCTWMKRVTLPYLIMAAFLMTACTAAHVHNDWPSDPAGQYALGFQYANNKNYADAFVLTRLAAEQGYAPAQAFLGILYELGQGVSKDDSLAALWYRRAAAQGTQTNAAAYLGKLYLSSERLKDPVVAAKWLKIGAANGHAQAQMLLGLMYVYGTGGLPQDMTLGKMWLRKAAAQGEEEARKALSSLPTGNMLSEILARRNAELSSKRQIAPSPPAPAARIPTESTPVCTLESRMTASFFNSTGNWSLVRVCR